MEDSSIYLNLLKIAPLAILVLAAVITVFRGLGRKPDSRNNQAKGGALSQFDHMSGGH